MLGSKNLIPGVGEAMNVHVLLELIVTCSHCTRTYTHTLIYVKRSLVSSLPLLSLLPADTQIRAEIPANHQILKPFLIFNHQALFIRKMQHANEAITCRNIIHSLFRVHGLQAVDDVCKREGAVDGFGGGICAGNVGRGLGRDLRKHVSSDVD
jgi:hypothetical protein